MSTKPVLAIDFGGVMSVHDRGAGNEHFKTNIDMPNCIDVLRTLSQKYELVLVSFCGKSRAIETQKVSRKQFLVFFQN